MSVPTSPTPATPTQSTELAEAVAILSAPPKPVRSREPGFHFNPRAGHSLILPAEFREQLAFAAEVEIKLAGSPRLAFVVGTRLLRRAADWSTPWLPLIYTPSKDPAHPRPLDMREGWQIPELARGVELVVDDDAGGVTRSCVVTPEFAAHLNARVSRGLGCDSYVGHMRQTLLVLERINADMLDHLVTHERTVATLS